MTNQNAGFSKGEEKEKKRTNQNAELSKGEEKEKGPIRMQNLARGRRKNIKDQSECRI